MTSRFSQVGLNNEKQEVPLVQFPYVSALCTGKHTEIILTQGVGAHTTLGMTRDRAIGSALDRCAALVATRIQELANEGDLEGGIARFIESHEGNIPEGYFDPILDTKKFMHGGRLIELMGKYGDTNLDNYGDTHSKPEFDFPPATRA